MLFLERKGLDVQKRKQEVSNNVSLVSSAAHEVLKVNYCDFKPTPPTPRAS